MIYFNHLIKVHGVCTWQLLAPYTIRVWSIEAYYHPNLQSDYLGANSKRGTYFLEVGACFMSETQVEL